MSPKQVRARTSTVSSDGRGPSDGVQGLRTLAELRADVEPGRGALADADLELAEAGPSATEPRTTSPIRTSPLAVLGGDAGARMVDGDVAVGRVAPAGRR